MEHRKRLEENEYRETERILYGLLNDFKNKPEYQKVTTRNLIKLYLLQSDLKGLRKLSEKVKTEETRTLFYVVDLSIEEHVLEDRIQDTDRKVEKTNDEFQKYKTLYNQMRIAVESQYTRLDNYTSRIIDRDRMRSVETLGVFAAMITFIITGVEITTNSNFNFRQVVLLMGEIGIALFLFVLMLRIVFDIPEGNEEKEGKDAKAQDEKGERNRVKEENKNWWSRRVRGQRNYFILILVVTGIWQVIILGLTLDSWKNEITQLVRLLIR